jgi:hypothetical protein
MCPLVFSRRGKDRVQIKGMASSELLVCIFDPIPEREQLHHRKSIGMGQKKLSLA